MEAMPEEKLELYLSELEAYRQRGRLLKTRLLEVEFYEQFDEVLQKPAGESLPAETVEMVWKGRALTLVEAISNHRKSHVLANK